MYSLHKYFINKLIIAPILQIPDFRSDRLYTPSRQNRPDEEMPFIKKEPQQKTRLLSNLLTILRRWPWTF